MIETRERMRGFKTGVLCRLQAGSLALSALALLALVVGGCSGTSDYPGDPAQWETYLSVEARAARGVPPLDDDGLRAERARACSEVTFTAPLTLDGGATIPPDVLNDGQELYKMYCRACHGDMGDGKGPASYSLRPPPRDFRLGTIKFASTPSGSLWLDDDVTRIVTGGLHGTAMLAWEVPPAQLASIVQYLKCFSVRWTEESPDDPIATFPDPWVGKTAEAVARGKLVYHGLAQCHECHAAYATRAEVADAAFELRKATTVEYRDDMYGPALKLSEEYGHSILPPDFLRHEVRSIRPGTELLDMYRVIGAGVGGTAMPSWSGLGVLGEKNEDIWAMAYYVKSLIDMKDTPAADALRARLLSPSNVVPPPKEAPPAAPDEGDDGGEDTGDGDDEEGGSGEGDLDTLDDTDARAVDAPDAPGAAGAAPGDDTGATSTPSPE